MKSYSDKIDYVMGCSVVIPAYNASKTIVRCINSCLEQSLLPQEIIIIDDESTDNTWEIIKAFSKQHTQISIYCFRNVKNLGVSATRNIGIQKASSTYIALLDADDIWHPEKLSICVELLERNADVPIMFHNYGLLQNDVVNSRPDTSSFHKETLSEILISNKLQGSVIVFRNGLNICFDDQYRYAEDLEFGIRYALTTQIIHLESTLTILDRPQLSIGGLSSNKWKMRCGEMKAIRSLPKYHWKYIFIVPFLLLFSLLKHIRKSIF